MVEKVKELVTKPGNLHSTPDLRKERNNSHGLSSVLYTCDILNTHT